jgi:hypothetical protein
MISRGWKPGRLEWLAGVGLVNLVTFSWGHQYGLGALAMG